MLKTLTKLAQKNVDHYHNHPSAHAALIAVSGLAFVATLAVIPKIVAPNTID